MKKDKFIESVLSGKPFLHVEYRSFEVDTINRKVVKVGESATMPIKKHKVLVGDDSYEVAEFVAPGEDVSKAVAPYKKGEMVILEIRTMEMTKYGTRINGDFHGKIEA